jgi:hypothetical protein
MLQRQQAALDGADAGDTFRTGGELLGVVADEPAPRADPWSRSGRPLSSQAEHQREHPSWVSFSSSIRDSRSGPSSEMVARTGCPCSPNTSQNVAGEAAKAESLIEQVDVLGWASSCQAG